MEAEKTRETAAVRAWVEDRRVWLGLADGRIVSFPVEKYPLLANASDNLLHKVTLRLGGFALRWEELDEDIWVDDAACGRFPRPQGTCRVTPPLDLFQARANPLSPPRGEGQGEGCSVDQRLRLY